MINTFSSPRYSFPHYKLNRLIVKPRLSFLEAPMLPFGNFSRADPKSFPGYELLGKVFPAIKTTSYHRSKLDLCFTNRRDFCMCRNLRKALWRRRFCSISDVGLDLSFFSKSAIASLIAFASSAEGCEYVLFPQSPAGLAGLADQARTQVVMLRLASSSWVSWVFAELYAIRAKVRRIRKYNTYHVLLTRRWTGGKIRSERHATIRRSLHLCDCQPRRWVWLLC